MFNFKRIAVFVLLALGSMVCNFLNPSPTPTESEFALAIPTNTVAELPTSASTQTQVISTTSTPPQSETPVASPCTLNAISEVTVYFRPNTGSNVFGTLSIGMPVEATARTSDGWIGFDPGVAQAANSGIFRLRWVQESGNITLEGACAGLPVVEVPPEGICFIMPMDNTSVYEEANLASNLVATLTAQEYAAVTGRTMDNWYRVDLAIGNTSSNQAGWVEESAINLNGPCDNLPVINIPSGQSLTPTGSNCTLTANADINAMMRPFPISNTFGTLQSGMSVPASAQTPNGWIGFDPGVAQAANVDIFRLRWVNPDSTFTLTGICANLPVVVGPPPQVCFNMATADTTVYTEADPSSTVVATLLAQEYAAVTAKTSENWYRIDLGFGNSASNNAGWIQGTEVNFNGRCDELPTITP